MRPGARTIKITHTRRACTECESLGARLIVVLMDEGRDPIKFVCCVCVCVCVCVCLSVRSYLASGASVRPENTVKYSVCNVGRKIYGIFSETVSFQSYRTFCIVRLPLSRPFSLWEYAREPAIIRAIPPASVAQAREYMQRFCSNDGVPALWRTATADTGPIPIINFVEHAHNASLFDKHTTPRVLHFSALV